MQVDFFEILRQRFALAKIDTAITNKSGPFFTSLKK